MKKIGKEDMYQNVKEIEKSKPKSHSGVSAPRVRRAASYERSDDDFTSGMLQDEPLVIHG